MANLPGSIKNLNTLLGEQLLDGGGSGGGGSSDFSTAQVTIATTIRLGAAYHMEFRQFDHPNYFTSLLTNDDGSLFEDSDDKIVTTNHPDVYNILFSKDGYVDIYFVTGQPIEIEGDGEVITETIVDEEVTYARAYGECTITKTTTGE